MTDQTNPTNKSAAGLLSDAIAHMSSLVRKEVDLARAEVSENVSRAGVAVGLLAGALVLALTALNVLAAALVAGLAETDLGPGWSALIVGLVLAAIALFLALKAKNDLKSVQHRAHAHGEERPARRASPQGGDHQWP